MLDHKSRADIVKAACDTFADTFAGYLVPGGCTSEEFEHTGENCNQCESCACEAEFSWKSCSICKSTLGGSRHAVAVIFPGTDRPAEFYAACYDCLAYLANGQLPNDEGV